MLCERCKKNNATLFYKETINGKTTSLSLCHDCAKELEKEGKLTVFSKPFVPSFSGFGAIDDLFSGFFAPTKKALAATEEKRCPLCASAFSDIVSNGKVGCAKCYETFRGELDRTIRSIHGNVKHKGRAAGPEKEKNDKKAKIASLREELGSAVKAEDFERAAKLRDEIKKLEGEI